MNVVSFSGNGSKYDAEEEFSIFLRIMAIKGFYEIFEYISRNNFADIKRIKNFVSKEQIVESNTMTKIILECLTNMGLIELFALDNAANPTYTLTKFGEKMVQVLNNTKTTFSST